jgi:hypothetical protein
MFQLPYHDENRLLCDAQALGHFGKLMRENTRSISLPEGRHKVGDGLGEDR